METVTLDVLIIEDMHVSAKFLKRALEQAESFKARFTHVENLTEALTTLERKTFDIIFLDLGLPDSLGPESVQKIFQRHPNVPILVMTGNNDLNLLKQTLAFGAVDFLKKDTIPAAALERCVLTAIIRKKTEKLLIEQSENKSLFLANMSHEIRTPLNAILGMIEVLCDQNPRSDQIDILEILKRSSQALMQLINEILDISKIESGRLELQRTKGNLPVIIKTVFSFIHRRAEEKGLEIGYTLDPTLSQYFWCDPSRLRQILVNLLSNAVKFTETGRVFLDVKIPSDRKDKILFVVSDTGPGMSKEFIPKLFNNYTQENRDIYGKYGGTGLGLSLTKSLVELMKGILRVKSEKSSGTTFFVEIPYESCEGQEDVLQKTHTFQNLEPLRILIAEDMPDNQYLLKLYFKSTPFQCDYCDNGELAVQKFQVHEYDVILMDMQMPVLDGFGAVEKIRKLEQQSQSPRRIPILALTANALKEEINRMIRSGCDAYVAKPVSRETLLNAIGSIYREPSKDEILFPRIDYAFLRQYDDLDQPNSPRVIEELFKRFLSGSPQLSQKLKEAISLGDTKLILHSAHGLRSICANIGAKRLSRICRKIEEWCEKSDAQSNSFQLQTLEQLFDDELSALCLELHQQLQGKDKAA